MAAREQEMLPHDDQPDHAEDDKNEYSSEGGALSHASTNRATGPVYGGKLS